MSNKRFAWLSACIIIGLIWLVNVLTDALRAMHWAT